MKSVYTNLDLRETMTEKEMYDEEKLYANLQTMQFLQIHYDSRRLQEKASDYHDE